MSRSKGRYFDGKSAMRHSVDVVFAKGGKELIISGDTLPVTQRWPIERLRALSDDARGYRLTVTIESQCDDEAQSEPARLSISEPALIAELQRSCPELLRRNLRTGTTRRIAWRASMAVAAIALVLFVILPRMADTLATLVPVEQEIALGKSVVAQIELALGGTETGTLHCSNRDGQVALEKLITRLTRVQEMKYQVNVTIFDHEMINAFAAPGGQIVVMRGLLGEADRPEELAGVLAHEIGHVERRDPTRHALRAAGSAGILSLVLGDFSGGTLAAILGEWLLRASYSREAEAEADRFALEMLNSAGIDSGGLARFFDRIEALEDSAFDLPVYFSTHPAAGVRADLAWENSEAQQSPALVLSDQEWEALRTICRAGDS